ncbi:MAG TPA: hypothetical protein VK674_04525 [Candidatus Limnocylindria bacterium]|nr:hypothetical protein [Candidatus Limnocylindria bacterium]
MRIKVTDPLIDYEGRVLVEGKEPVTFRRVFVTALNTFPDNDRPPAEQMAQIYALSVKLYVDDEAELSLEEAALIKDRVGRLYNPLVYGRTCELLEGQHILKKKK